MDKLKKLTQKIFDECARDGEPVTMDEALDMAKMELNSKNFDHEARESAPKAKSAPKKPHTVKVSDEKKELFSTILQNLTRAVGVESENITVLTENKLIECIVNGKIFKIDVVECRNKAK